MIIFEDEIDRFGNQLTISGAIRVLDCQRKKYQQQAWDTIQDKDIDFAKKFSDFALWINIYFDERTNMDGVILEVTKDKKIRIQYRYSHINKRDTFRVIMLNEHLEIISTYLCDSIKNDDSIYVENVNTIKYDNIYPEQIIKGIEKAKKCMGVIAYL